MKKNLYLMGKVYDMTTPIADVERDINARLLDYTKLELTVHISERSKNELEITLFRHMDNVAEQGWIDERDTWLITGEGYNGFVPEYSLPHVGHIIPNGNYYEYVKDFIKFYKRNAVFYGGSRVKDVAIESNSDYLRMIVKYR